MLPEPSAASRRAITRLLAEEVPARAKLSQYPPLMPCSGRHGWVKNIASVGIMLCVSTYVLVAWRSV